MSDSEKASSRSYDKGKHHKKHKRRSRSREGHRKHVEDRTRSEYRKDPKSDYDRQARPVSSTHEERLANISKESNQDDFFDFTKYKYSLNKIFFRDQDLIKR